MMQSNRINIIGMICALMTFFGIITAHAQMQMPPAYVSVEKVKNIQESDGRKYSGRLEAVKDVNLVARVSGFLEKIYFKEGDLVKKGDILFEIEDTVYAAQVNAAEAKVKQAKAQLDYADKNYDRQKELYGSKITSESVMEDATRTKELAEAALMEVEAALLTAKNDLSYTKIYAPISGRIGKSSFTEGNYVSPSSSALATIVQDAPIYAVFSISEPDFYNLFGTTAIMKNEANIRLRTADRKMYSSASPKGEDESIGKVVLADNRVDSSTGTIKIWGEFANSEQKLIPGGLVDVFISRKTTQSFPSVLATAVMQDKSGSYVYVLDKENTVARRSVVLGELIASRYIVKEGLQENETVIVDGVHKTFPSAKVIPVPAEQKNKIQK